MAKRGDVQPVEKAQILRSAGLVFILWTRHAMKYIGRAGQTNALLPRNALEPLGLDSAGMDPMTTQWLRWRHRGRRVSLVVPPSTFWTTSHRSRLLHEYGCDFAQKG